MTLKSTISNPVFLLLALTGLLMADVPKKAPLSNYSALWGNSPFTSKPPPPEAGPQTNPLDDYALIGVSPISGHGYRVTMMNKKQPDQRITVDSGSAKTDFKIIEVVRKSGDPLGTTVRMTSGSMTGTVSFDRQLLTLVSAAPVNNPQPGQPQIQPPGQPNMPPGVPGQPQMRQPRPRVIPPPVPQAAAAPPGQAIAPQTAKDVRIPRRRN
jgi:hypothetical protein